MPPDAHTPAPTDDELDPAALAARIDRARLPRHVAIIMDGNGRWAESQGQPRVFGHRNGVKAVDEVTEAAAELGIDYLTLYAFSTENWGRPQPEVDALMTLLVDTIEAEVPKLQNNRIRLESIGDLTRLPPRSRKTLLQAIADTRANDRMTLVLALNYSAKWEILEAVRAIAHRVAEGRAHASEIDEAMFTAALSTHGMPDPELLIRTSGESRISNFLLWQLAYAELHFTPTFWPDFRKRHFYEALLDFQERERRFGKTGAQLRADAVASDDDDDDDARSAEQSSATH